MVFARRTDDDDADSVVGWSEDDSTVLGSTSSGGKYYFCSWPVGVWCSPEGGRVALFGFVRHPAKRRRSVLWLTLASTSMTCCVAADSRRHAMPHCCPCLGLVGLPCVLLAFAQRPTPRRRCSSRKATYSRRRTRPRTPTPKHNREVRTEPCGKDRMDKTVNTLYQPYQVFWVERPGAKLAI